MNRLRRIVLTAALIALGASGAGAQPHPWAGHGRYVLRTSVECMGAGAMGIHAVYRFHALGPAVIVGVSDDVLPDSGDLQGTVRGKGGRVLAGRIAHRTCGEGRFKFVIDGTLGLFRGVLRFGAMKGAVQGTYLYDSADRYDVRLSLRFAAARRGSIAPGKRAVLIAVVENAGPQTMPLGSVLLRLRFSAPVGFDRVVVVKKLGQLDLGVELDPGTPEALLDLPVAVGEVLVLAVRFVVPESLAGTILAVDGDFVAAPQLPGSEPVFVPPASAHTEIAVEEAQGVSSCERLHPFYGGGFLQLSVDGGPPLDMVPQPDAILRPGIRVVSVASDVGASPFVFVSLYGRRVRTGTHPVRPDPDTDSQALDHAVGGYRAAIGNPSENAYEMFDGTITIDTLSGGARHEIRGHFDTRARNARGDVVHLVATFRHCGFVIERAGRDDVPE